MRYKEISRGRVPALRQANYMTMGGDTRRLRWNDLEVEVALLIAGVMAVLMVYGLITTYPIVGIGLLVYALLMSVMFMAYHHDMKKKK